MMIALIFGIVLIILALVFFRIWHSPNRRGQLSKLSTLFGFKVEKLEKDRWIFVAIKEGSTSDLLVVSFAGGALRIGGHTRPEFQKTLATFDCDQLYLTDPSQSYYLNDPQGNWNGFEYHNNKLKELTSSYKYVLFIGASMGGSAALLFSHLANGVIAFNPLIDLEGETRFNFRIGIYFLPKSLRVSFRQTVCQNIEKGTGVINIHVSNSKEEIFHTLGLPSKTNVNLYHDHVNHNLAIYLRNNGKLVPIIKNEVERLRSS